MKAKGQTLAPEGAARPGGGSTAGRGETEVSFAAFEDCLEPSLPSRELLEASLGSEVCLCSSLSALASSLGFLQAPLDLVACTNLIAMEKSYLVDA